MREAEVDDIPPTEEQVELDIREPGMLPLASLDEFRLLEIFKQTARVRQTVPLFLKGAFRGALRVAVEEPPRILLSRPPRQCASVG